MATYLLNKKCGNHIGPPNKEGDRTTYKSGSKIVSDEDLAAKYPGKFTLINASGEIPAPTAPKP